MKVIRSIVAAGLLLVCGCAAAQQRRPAANPDGPFRVTVGECTNGHIEVSPAIPAEGKEFPKGAVLHIKATADPGYAFECGYKAMGGRFAFYTEYPDAEFDVTVDGACSIGASFVEPSRLQGYRCIQDIVYAKPGVKTLKYDAFVPDGARKLPGIVIIHGGGWTMNCEDVMKGLARELVKDGKYVVFSIDYRWNIEDCYGAILHIQEHAAEYGLDPKRLAVTGDSAGGHLCASVANMIERVGDGGFGEKPGVYEYLPTYMPKGMSAKKARKKLLAIKAVAPNYGIFSVSGIERFVSNLPEDGQEVYYVKVPGAAHAYYDWKPDTATKETFNKYGEPYARQMEDFFNTVFYK